MPLVIHLIPYDGIGGAERAASSMSSISEEGLDFHVETIFPSLVARYRWMFWNPWYYLSVVARLVRIRPDVLIASLWRACIVGIILKLIRPSTRLVLFLHSTNDAHLPDSLLTKITERLACKVWADSHETLLRRIPELPVSKGCEISYVASRIRSLPAHPVEPVFVYWGRIHPKKGLQRALIFFSKVQRQWSDARFLVIGPDDGDLKRISRMVNELGLHQNVQLLGPMNFEQICLKAAKASFYLQTSELEGMALSVVEAMQLGLVPVVTPVGEIAHYARSGDNAVIISDDSSALAEVLVLLTEDERYQKYRINAISTWANRKLYKDSVLDACFQVLDMPSVGETN